MTGDRLLTVPEVAEKLRTTPGTLRWWRHVGQGPESFKVGRRVVYYASVIDAYIAQQAETTSSKTQ